jgi:hypothetical protein
MVMAINSQSHQKCKHAVENSESCANVIRHVFVVEKKLILKSSKENGALKPMAYFYDSDDKNSKGQCRCCQVIRDYLVLQ